jgi:hypothetical protein
MEFTSASYAPPITRGSFLLCVSVGYTSVPRLLRREYICLGLLSEDSV